MSVTRRILRSWSMHHHRSGPSPVCHWFSRIWKHSFFNWSEKYKPNKQSNKKWWINQSSKQSSNQTNLKLSQGQAVLHPILNVRPTYPSTHGFGGALWSVWSCLRLPERPEVPNEWISYWPLPILMVCDMFGSCAQILEATRKRVNCQFAASCHTSAHVMLCWWEDRGMLCQICVQYGTKSNVHLTHKITYRYCAQQFLAVCMLGRIYRSGCSNVPPLLLLVSCRAEIKNSTFCIRSIDLNISWFASAQDTDAKMHIVIRCTDVHSRQRVHVFFLSFGIFDLASWQVRALSTAAKFCRAPWASQQRFWLVVSVHAGEVSRSWPEHTLTLKKITQQPHKV